MRPIIHKINSPLTIQAIKSSLNNSAINNMLNTHTNSQTLKEQIAVKAEHGAVPVPDGHGLRDLGQLFSHHIC